MWGARACSMTNETSTARLEGALPPTRHHLVARSTRVTSTAPLIRPATVSPSPSPTRSRRSAMAGRSPSSWVIVILPRPSRRPLPAAPPVAQSGAHLLVPAESVVPQAAVDRPVDGCVAHAQVGALDHDAALDLLGGPVPVPYQPGHQLQAPGIGQQGLAAAPPRPALALVVGGARPVAPHPARHRAVPPVRADLARHRGLVPADKAGRSRSPPHGSPTRP